MNINKVMAVQSNPTPFFQREVTTKFESSINYWRRNFYFGSQTKMTSPDIINIEKMGPIKSLLGGGGAKHFKDNYCHLIFQG